MNKHERSNDANLRGDARILQSIPAFRFHTDETQLRQELQTYRRKHEEARKGLEVASTLLSRITGNATEGILVTDAHGIIQSVNPAFEKSTGYTADEAFGHTPALFKSGRHDKDFYRQMWSTLNEQGQWQGEVWNRNKSGEIYPEWLNISAVKDSQQRVTHYVGIFSDIHTQEYILDRLRYLANYDGLTGLPNRRLFLDRLNVYLTHARRDKQMLAVMFVDLDRFKQINDTYGHRIGDGLLVAVAERMKGCLREGDTLARLGGDEFTVILPALAHRDDAANVAKKFLECCTRPVNVAGHELDFSASIGVAIYPGHGDDADSLLQHADVAMYNIKAAGRNGYLLYQEGMAMCTLPGDPAGGAQR
jgi:diguanylate cyclase (GGDEF)-like protein/PAS domain S-box-containing protein